MKILNRIFKLIVITSFFLCFVGQTNYVFASDWDIFSSADSFVEKGKNAISNENDFNMENLRINSSNLFNILTAIGIVLTVIIGGILGIKFMMASAEDKAQIKQMMIPYVVGCVIIYGAFGIWKLVLSIMEQI